MTTQLALKMLAALAVAAVVSFLTTPMVKSLAYIMEQSCSLGKSDIKPQLSGHKSCQMSNLN